MKKKQFMSKLAALTMAAAMGVTALPAMTTPVMADTVKGATTNDDTDAYTAAKTGLVQTDLPSISDLNLGDNQTYYAEFLKVYKIFDSKAEEEIEKLDKNAHADEVSAALVRAAKAAKNSTGFVVSNVDDSPATGDTTSDAGTATATIKLPYYYTDASSSQVTGTPDVTLKLTWGTKAADALKEAVSKTTSAIEGTDDSVTTFGDFKDETKLVNSTTKALDISKLSVPSGISIATDYSDYTVAYSDLKASNYVAPTYTAAGGYDLSLKVTVSKAKAKDSSGTDIAGTDASADQTITCHVTFPKKTAKRVAAVATDSTVNTADTVWTASHVTKTGVAYPIDIKVTYDGAASPTNKKAELADANIMLSLSDDSVAHLVDSDSANTGKALVFDKVGEVTIKYTCPNYKDPDKTSATATISKTDDLEKVTLVDADTAFKAVLSGLDKTVTSTEVSKEDDIEAVVKNKVQAAYDAYYGKSTKLTITVKDVQNFKAATAGTAENPDGTNGSFYVTVKAENVAPNATLTATSYDAWTITADKYTAKFTDVADTDYFAKAVAWGVDKDIVAGTTDTTFSPKADVTRAQFVTFLYRQAGSPDVEINKTFTDISGLSTEFQKAISWAAANGITDGVTDTTFAPNATVNREQAVTFLFRYTKGEATTKTASFKDVDSTAYYADAVNWGAENGVVEGYNDDTFGVGRSTNRGEAITFIYRALAD